MWKLEKVFRFEAAHRLPHHSGKCKRLHGHSWIGRVVVEGHSLHEEGPQTGMVLDYAEIKEPVKHMLAEYLDHHYLNDTLAMESPTSEAIAKWCFDWLRIRVPGIVAVVIEETCTCRCEYRPLIPTTFAGAGK